MRVGPDSVSAHQRHDELRQRMGPSPGLRRIRTEPSRALPAARMPAANSARPPPAARRRDRRRADGDARRGGRRRAPRNVGERPLHRDGDARPARPRFRGLNQQFQEQEALPNLSRPSLNPSTDAFESWRCLHGREANPCRRYYSGTPTQRFSALLRILPD